MFRKLDCIFYEFTQVLFSQLFECFGIDRENNSTQNSHRDILGVIRQKTKISGDKDKGGLVVWLDIRAMIGKIEGNI